MKKIVLGNDFNLIIPVSRKVHTSTGDVIQDFNLLPACTDLQVNLVNFNETISLPCSVDVEHTSRLIANVDSSKLNIGNYALEVKGKIYGNAWRSNEYEQIAFVNNNASADEIFDGEIIEGESSVEVDHVFILLPPTADLTQLIDEASEVIGEANTALDTMNKATEGANKVDIDLNEANLEITRRTGEKKNFDLSTLKGEKGDGGKVQNVLVYGESALVDSNKVNITNMGLLRCGSSYVTPYIDNYPTRPTKALVDTSEYMYCQLDDALDDNEIPYYIYDVQLNKFIELTKNTYQDVDSGDFFNTSEPLDLSHELYLDNDKTGDISDLTKLEIEDSNLFIGLPYVCKNDDLEDDQGDQYIWDATSRKWITVLESWYFSGGDFFNTSEPLDLSHELIGVSLDKIPIKTPSTHQYSIAIGYQATSNTNSISMGHNASAGDSSISIGHNASANNQYSIAMGYQAKANSQFAIAMGYQAQANNPYGSAYTNAIAIGYQAQADNQYSIAIGYQAQGHMNSITMGYQAKGYGDITLGYKAVSNNYSIAIGSIANASKHFTVAIGYQAKASNQDAIVIGFNLPTTKSIYTIGIHNVNVIDMDVDNKGLYLIGLGGYTGTNLVVKEGSAEKLNPNIKSVQDLIKEKVVKETVDFIADATTAEDVVTKFNQLLANLRSAGIMKSK